MIPRIVVSTALAALLGGSGQAMPPLKSGPPVGAPNDRSGFMPQWVAGFCANQKICPV